ncbi:MAG TPA: clostripain-related cysteine peptidase [Candidatus Angelobacter sp.]|nr:clostripain-related cysteine peptidase [Candidatus Angelobacter sp.]
MTNQQDNQTANWMIMVYIAADDVLANFAVGSLKQLKRLASQNDNDNVVVAAQFDANGQLNIARLIFDGTGNKSESLQGNKVDEVAADINMATPFALTSFINWAYAQREAQHYCLFLWGHGPELLVDDYPVLASGQKVKKFLTPSELKSALKDTNLAKAGNKFDIVGIDACCMSLVELACELPDHADFLVASQEEVPDFSFPYDQLRIFGKNENSRESATVCKEIPKRYVAAYRDYIVTREERINSITLSGLSLKDIAAVVKPLDRLAAALMNSIHDENKRQAVIDARANSRGFVAGLYVDLYHFCWQLCCKLSSEDPSNGELLAACTEICDAIDSRDDDALVIANESADKNCHGLSIYFPYMTDAELAGMESSPPVRQKGLKDPLNSHGTNGLTNGKISVEEKSDIDIFSDDEMDVREKGGMDVLAKGGIDVPAKGGIDVLAKGGIDVLAKLRRQRIEETEQYYADLELSKKTRWAKFIRHGWSRWLAEEAASGAKPSPAVDMSGVLDQRYSAQQCAINLLSLCKELEKEKTSGYSHEWSSDQPPHRGAGHRQPSN